MKQVNWLNWWTREAKIISFYYEVIMVLFWEFYVKGSLDLTNPIKLFLKRFSFQLLVNKFRYSTFGVDALVLCNHLDTALLAILRLQSSILSSFLQTCLILGWIIYFVFSRKYIINSILIPRILYRLPIIFHFLFVRQCFFFFYYGSLICYR